jgi:hypothetical protein
MRIVACPRCQGKGKTAVMREREHIFAPFFVWEECAACQGRGVTMNALRPQRSASFASECGVTLATSGFSLLRATTFQSRPAKIRTPVKSY